MEKPPQATFSYLPRATALDMFEQPAKPDADATKITVGVFDTLDFEQDDPDLASIKDALCERNAIISDYLAESGGSEYPGLRTTAHFVGDLNGDASIDPVFGHHYFIQDIIERIAPRANVVQDPVVTNQGWTTDVTVARALTEFAAGRQPGIITLSLGVYTEDDMAPPALRSTIKGLTDKGWIVVASAGNDRSCRPSYPAALAEVVAVAATGPYGPAWFTNFGSWVNACAPGLDIIGRLPDPYRTASDNKPATPGRLYKDDVEVPDGVQVVSWSGTSFSAPAVAATIARGAERILVESGGTLDVKEALRYAKYELIDEPTLLRWNGLGTVVNTTPSYDPPLPIKKTSA